MSVSVERITPDDSLLAIIVSDRFSEPGIHFFTEADLSQQLAYMKHPKGHKIGAHVHKPVPRNVKYTQETLFIKKGRVRINFYDENKQYFDTRELGSGDVILLVSGGHDFTMLEDTEMIEVKQGPYAGNGDKERFKGTGPGFDQ